MIHGDIANTIGYTFGFRVENSLVKFRDKTIFDKAYNYLFDASDRAVIDEGVFSIMEYIYRDTEYTVDVVIDEEFYTVRMKGLLDNMPFNRVVLVNKPVQITTRLMIGDITYYVDSDEQRLGLINSPYAVTPTQLQDILRRKRV